MAGVRQPCGVVKPARTEAVGGTLGAGLQVYCLGGLRARLDGLALAPLAGSKPLGLWLYLALGGGTRSRACLAEFFWGELDDSAARANLRLALWRLRRLIPEHIGVTRHQVFIPAPSRFWIDAAQPPPLDDFSADAVESLLARRPEEFLAGVHLRHAPQFDDWVSEQRRRLVDEHLAALTRVAERLTAQAEAERAAAVYRRCLSLAPWSEEHHRALIRCYGELGRVAAALSQYEACRDALRRELDVDPAAATRALVEQIRRAPGPAAGAVSEGSEACPGATPGATGAPLVNRAAERDRIVGLLREADCRLVSIVGPGGVGKSRLARHLATSLTAAFSDGVRCVELADEFPAAPGDSAGLVLSRIAETLSLAGASACDRKAVLAALAERELLLVLDNFEQLSAAAELLEAITLHAPRVRVLVTSRHRLGLATEWVVMLDGLAVPETPDWSEASRACPAVELFLQAAARVEAGFDAAANGPHILRICRSLEGHPLAILLAARWLASMSCREIAECLGADLSLVSEPRAPRGRHDSLGTVLDRSWALLGEEERAAFSALSVFRGGFTPAAASAVVPCRLAVLDSLACKSMLRRRGDGRLEVHELMREWGAAMLAGDPPRARAVRQRHADYYAALLGAELAGFEDDPLSPAFPRARPELANLLTVFETRLEGDEPALLAELLRGLWAIHRRLGWFDEVAGLLRRALQREAVPQVYRCRWQLWLSEACFQGGWLEESLRAARESLQAAGQPLPVPAASGGDLLWELAKFLLPLCRRAPAPSLGASPEDLARAHNRLAQLCFFEGDRMAFLANTLRSVNAAAGAGADLWASAALALAHTPLRAQARVCAERAERGLARAEPFVRAWAHEQLALYALGLGRFDDSVRHATQGARLFGELGQAKNWGECSCLVPLGPFLRGDLEAARAANLAVLPQARARRERYAEVWCHCHVAHLALRLRRPSELDLAAVAERVGELVDPNTALLYHGTRAWQAARREDVETALAALEICRRIAGRASMLSIYAIYGFIGEVMALAELRAKGDAGHRPTVNIAPAVLGDFRRFARPFPAAWPYVAYLQGCWFIAAGRTARGEARRAWALDRLDLAVPAAEFARGLSVAGR